MNTNALSRTNGAFFIGTTLYFHTGSYIVTYDIKNKIESNPQSTSYSGDHCMAQSPNNNDIVYYVSPSGHSSAINKFYKFELSTGMATQGPSLNESRIRFIASCITNGDYLYVFGAGQRFERINLIEYEENPASTYWQDISFDYNNVNCDDGTKLHIDNIYIYLVNYGDYIFIVGNGWGSYAKYIGIFDTNSEELYCGQGVFPSTVGLSHMTAAIGGEGEKQRLFAFGGFTGGADKDTIYYSNYLEEIVERSTTVSARVAPTTPEIETKTKTTVGNDVDTTTVNNNNFRNNHNCNYPATYATTY